MIEQLLIGWVRRSGQFVMPTLALALMVPVIHAGEVDKGPFAWRRPDNDGLNCLFLMLSGMGYHAPYAEFSRDIAGLPELDQLNGLAGAAKTLGFGLVPVSMTMTELERLSSPVIVHLEQQGGATGYYVLVRGFDDENVILYHGGKATAEAMQRDIFRREWSGFGLVPAQDSGRFSSFRKVVAACAAAAAVGALGYRFF